MAAANCASWQELQPHVYCILKDVFGFQSFRGVQEDAIKAALQGRDAFVLMPTGGGKSLCYALPAVVRGGLVVVVSPLIALMQDQVCSLQALGVAAEYLASSRTAAERKAVLARLTGPANGGEQLALLYVTPELLATDSFRQRLVSLHTAKMLQMLAVDEAHCISQWGHDFRPAYRQLAQLRGQLEGLPCMALTATATQQVQQDVLSSLHMRNPAMLITSFNRPNIHYTVTLLDVQQPPALNCNSDDAQRQHSSAVSSTPARSTAAAAVRGHALHADDEAGDNQDDDADFAGYDQLLQLLKPAGRPKRKEQQLNEARQKQRPQREGPPGNNNSKSWAGPVAIIYALKRSTVDVLVRRLSSQGLAVAGYHATLPDAFRAGVLEQWRAGQLQVVVATVAFGMGVDKGDIELVVHFNLPRSLESFYQESGRAGRNGQPARSVLFYSTKDRRRMDYILQKDADSKVARKRKKAAKTAADSTQQGTQGAAAGAQGTATAAAGVDPVAAAAALRGFGCIVDLCTQPGCRRARLLKHFGEELKTPHHNQQQGSAASDHSISSTAAIRCCDYCDDSGSVEAAMQQLKDKELELLQKWRGSRAGQWSGSKRQRWGDAGMFGGDFASSESEDNAMSGESDDDVEMDPGSVAAAAAVAKAAAVAAKAAGTRAGASDTDAFLAAMVKAEQRHNKQQTSAAAGDGDPLARLLAMKAASAASKQVPGGLTDAVRSSRRAKLAELISSNAQLTGCTAEAAADIAAALEAAVTPPGTTAEQHRAAVSKLAAGVKQANTWTELPGLQQLLGKGLNAVLQLGVQATVQAATQLQKSRKAQQPGTAAKSTAELHGQASGVVSTAEAVVMMLTQLAKLPVTVAALEATGVAKQIKALKKHPDELVAAAAGAVIAEWRRAVTTS